jgi:hypothetical protein
MRKTVIIFMILFVQVSTTHICHAGLFDGLKKLFNSSKQEQIDESTIVTALKEAISIGTDNAVKSVSELDGYLTNQQLRFSYLKNLK